MKIRSRAESFLLIVLAIATSATQICSTCWPNEIFTQPAVGLDFGPSRGLAIFKWPNETIQEIAAIQGNDEYTAAMLEMSRHFERIRGTELQRQIPSDKYDAAVVDDIFYDAPTPISVSISKALYEMAKQLKAQVDLSLSPSPVAILGATFPAFFKIDHQMLLDQAIRARAGFEPSLSYFQANSAIASATANRVRVCQCPVFGTGCTNYDYPDDEMILSIDFSDLLLTMFLYRGNDPEGWNKGGIAHVKLGPSSDAQDNDVETEYWSEVVAELRTLVFRQAINGKIDHLVLSGTRTSDPNLHDAIQSGIGGLNYNKSKYHKAASAFRLGSESVPIENLLVEAVVDSTQTSVVNPVTAPAQGAADLSWRQNMRICIDPCSQWRYIPLCKEEWDSLHGK